ncbi:hypothetical protein SAMN05880590_101488 [Rhizobium sp. RU35A]|nr:hypothetical protein SAMN05880590_101488 [Rhizobium sp. RU35A]
MLTKLYHSPYVLSLNISLLMWAAIIWTVYNMVR